MNHFPKKPAIVDAQPRINFECSIQDKQIIGQILQRGMLMAADANVQIDHLTAAMDITACHCNGAPLKLLQFLMSDNNDFAHDFTGIGLHINRATGMLKHGWAPIFADAKH